MGVFLMTRACSNSAHLTKIHKNQEKTSLNQLYVLNTKYHFLVFSVAKCIAQESSNQPMTYTCFSFPFNLLFSYNCTYNVTFL